MESSIIYKQEYLLRIMSNLLKYDNAQDYPNEIKLQTEFEISDFSKLDCELSKIDLYLTNYRPTVLNNEETLLVFSEYFDAIGETYNKLETLWTFVHKNYFVKVDFVQIYEMYLRFLEVSKLLIKIVKK